MVPAASALFCAELGHGPWRLKRPPLAFTFSRPEAVNNSAIAAYIVKRLLMATGRRSVTLADDRVPTGFESFEATAARANERRRTRRQKLRQSALSSPHVRFILTTFPDWS
jgi:hypothetical protein